MLTHDEIVEAMAEAIYEDQRLDHDGMPWGVLRHDSWEVARIRADARAALSALRRLADERGYRLMVPREADEPMQIAAIDRPAADAIGRGLYLSVWSAMLAAAPDPTQGGT